MDKMNERDRQRERREREIRIRNLANQAVQASLWVQLLNTRHLSIDLHRCWVNVGFESVRLLIGLGNGVAGSIAEIVNRFEQAVGSGGLGAVFLPREEK